ncbi:Uncharacterised protein [Bacteroides heparinolyticus]|uniref:DUF4859 domain-containing protein n=1 Tax=Prevotella heparinolytica TaxID=28113 RepID=A0A449I4V9_9BACE|nr:DUF4859 domain-containing protein [Bacteroides heparinolyticus]VFB14447.1 Uncharacterised protein [Bacteroides heparinolyticus]
MKKNFIYIVVSCFVLLLTACSTDPEDATGKHVYGENENPYLKSNVNAVVATKAEFPISRLVPKRVKLTDYADKFHTYLGMTVDETLSALSNGSVVFYPINVSRNCWNKTAPTKGTAGWYYNTAGGVSDAASGIAGIELDAASKELVLNVEEAAPVGTALSINVGFAINNGKDFDDYVRFSFDLTVTDPGRIVVSQTIPAGDYATFSINFADYTEVIESCMGMTVKEFSKAVLEDRETGSMAMYLVDSEGNWNETGKYTANGLGYWLTLDAQICNWGDTAAFFVETGDACVNIGRYPGIASGTVVKVSFVYTLKSDKSKFVAFIVTATMA